jgi:C-terminal processing protease CtpA/Prc
MNEFCQVTVLLFATFGCSAQISPTITGVELGGLYTESCPAIVTGVIKESPAARAGVKPGDVLVAVNGSSVIGSPEATKPLFSSATENPVILRLIREDNAYTITVGREDRNTVFARLGEKVLSNGMIVPLDATETEMNDKMKSLTQDRFVNRVFPSHFPKNEKLYYAGFEVLILKNPSQVVVLGIENGPASRVGVHWGDTILSVDGIDPRDKSVLELERLFSSDKPTSMTLRIRRGSLTKTYLIKLEQTAQVLRDNATQVVNANPLPSTIPDKYLSCFAEPPGTK